MEKVKIRIRKVEERTKDSWVDMSLHALREGEVRFYRVSDPLTGKWLFKVCRDYELHRIIIKALKCPPGGGFVQIEGRTMLFQKSLVEDHYYDVISLFYIDENKRLRRNIVGKIEEIPETIRNNFKIVSYEKATGKKAIGKKLVTLCKEKDEKKMVILFLIQRAWPISKIPPDIGARIFELLNLIKNLERVQVNDVYQTAGEQYELTKEDTDVLLRLLETEGKILRSGEYIKTK